MEKTRKRGRPSRERAVARDSSEGNAFVLHLYNFYELYLVPISQALLTLLINTLREVHGLLLWILNRMLPKPLAIIWLLSIGPLLYSTILPAIFCLVPGASYFNPGCVGTDAGSANLMKPPQSNTMFIAENNKLYGNVINQAAPLQKLPYEMTCTEMAIRDVRNQLIISSLPASTRKDMLRELDMYIDSSEDTMDRLQGFTANLLGAVDLVLINTEWTILELNRLEVSNRPRNLLFRGILWFDDHWTRPILGLGPSENVAKQTGIQIKKHFDIIEPDLSNLIVEAQVLLANFEALRQPLKRMKTLTTVDGKRAADDLAHHLAQQWSWEKLWVLVGGEPEAMGAYGRQVDMLHQVDYVVDAGMSSIGKTLVELRAIKAQTSTLRDRLHQSKNKDVPDKSDLVKISIGAEQLRTLQVAEKMQVEEISRHIFGPRGG